MTTFYCWDAACLYVGAKDADEDGPLPERSTPTKPPKLTGTQVARWTGSGWEKLAAAPEPEPAPDWPALIATRRWLAETSGTTFGGMPIDTDDRSKLLINGAAMRADRSADYVLRWKTSEGFVDLTAAQVLAVADAVSDHVQLCFDREDALLGAVADGSITSRDAGRGVAGMSRFVTTLKTDQTDRRTYTLLDNLVLADEELGAITVPQGFQTDFASIKVLHNAFLFVLFALVSGYGNYAATVHDWLYFGGQVSRKEADAVLYRALRAEGVARWRAWLFWVGVRIGGAKQYTKTPTRSGFSSSGD